MNDVLVAGGTGLLRGAIAGKLAERGVSIPGAGAAAVQRGGAERAAPLRSQ